MDESQDWYLMKHDDGATFGPIPFSQLRRWALDAQVSPLDKVSTDGQNWFKAPMVPDLEMDYLVEVTPDQFYGPTNLGTIREFLQMGEINEETQVTNCKDGSASLIKDIEELRPEPEEEPTVVEPVRTSIRYNLQQRIRELETMLMEERRGRENAEHLVAKLESKLEEITRAASL